jgi:hypothetical protein
MLPDSVPRDEVLGDRLGGEERTEQVDLEHPLEVVRRDLQHGHGLRDPGAVDEAREALRVVAQRCERGVDRRDVGHVDASRGDVAGAERRSSDSNAASKARCPTRRGRDRSGPVPLRPHARYPERRRSRGPVVAS